VVHGSPKRRTQIWHGADSFPILVDLSSMNVASTLQDHFVPLYIAAGAGEDGEAKLLSGMYGAITVAFGL
jgi:hypothetical protein